MVKGKGVEGYRMGGRERGKLREGRENGKGEGMGGGEESHSAPARGGGATFASQRRGRCLCVTGLRRCVFLRWQTGEEALCP